MVKLCACVTLKKQYFHIVRAFEKPDRGVLTASAVKQKLYLPLLL